MFVKQHLSCCIKANDDGKKVVWQGILLCVLLQIETSVIFATDVFDLLCL